MRTIALASGLAILFASLMLLAACSDRRLPSTPVAAERSFGEAPRNALVGASYLVLAKDTHWPEALTAEVESAGSDVTSLLPQVGIAVVTATDASFLGRVSAVSGVRSVVPDLEIEVLDEPPPAPPLPPYCSPPSGATGEFFRELQWGLDAIQAPGAWAQGARGEGVRVAILDTGIDVYHPDLLPNLNTSLAKSFVPGVGYTAFNGCGVPFYSALHHGTHVAGIIAAAENNYGVVGVAPEAEIVPVRVITDGNSAAFSWIISGIVYAADIDADVINMSLGGMLGRRGGIYNINTGELVSPTTAQHNAEILVAFTRAVNYAYRSGATMVAALGNASIDLDDTDDLIFIPAQLPHVIAVAATGPLGWALDHDTNPDLPAIYTNYGVSAVDFAAPGGNLDAGLANSTCTVVVTQVCIAYDLVFSTMAGGGWFWNSGTSMATPHVSGVAALIIGQHGGSMAPAQVEAALRRGADDLGKPGRDEFYGLGRINAARSVEPMDSVPGGGKRVAQGM